MAQSVIRAVNGMLTIEYHSIFKPNFFSNSWGLSDDNIGDMSIGAKKAGGAAVSIPLWYDHKNLCTRPAVDPVFSSSPYVPYKPADFSTEPAREKNVTATWYADEKNGTEWQGHLTSTGELFNTYDYTAALNSSHFKKFPLGSYVRVTSSVPETKPQSVIVKITDTKGDGGIDLSKAAWRALDIDKSRTSFRENCNKKIRDLLAKLKEPKQTKKQKSKLNARIGALRKKRDEKPTVELTLLRPKECQPIRNDGERKIVACHPKNIMLLFSRSWLFDAKRGSYNRTDYEVFVKRHWSRAERFYKKSLAGGLQRPFIYSEAPSFKERKILSEERQAPRRLVSAVGPFANEKSARIFVENYCSFYVDRPFSFIDVVETAMDCAGVMLYSADERTNPKGAYYDNNKKPMMILVASKD